MPVGLFETLLLALFLDECLDYAYSCNILLDDTVKPIQAFLQNSEERIRAPDHEDDVDENQRKSTGHNHTEAQIQ